MKHVSYISCIGCSLNLRNDMQSARTSFGLFLMPTDFGLGSSLKFINAKRLILMMDSILVKYAENQLMLLHSCLQYAEISAL